MPEPMKNKGPRRTVVGWSRTRMDIPDAALVLDVGSGAFPTPRADVLCEAHPDDDVHRSGARPTVDDRPFVVADVTALPFKDCAFDVVIASHVAEHVADPDAMCRELSRTGRSGYIETPSPVAEWLLNEEVHLWTVGRSNRTLIFRRKGRRGAIGRLVGGAFYGLYFAGRLREGRRTLHSNRRAVNLLLRGFGIAFAGTLNRAHVMHTRYRFDTTRPLSWRVDPPGPWRLRP